MASGNTTQDHDFIREWAEKRGAKPAEVASTETEGAPGILRLEFPGAPNANDDALKEISWDDFFEKFDQSGLEFLYQEETAGGEQSNFNKLIYPEPDSPAGKRLLSKSSRKKSSGKKVAGKKSASKGASLKGAGRTATKKAPAAKKTATKKTPSKKSAAKKTVAKKAAAKKTALKKVAGKKVAAKKVVAKKVAPKKSAVKSSAKKATAKKAAGRTSRR
jgi:hypothetical protein